MNSLDAGSIDRMRVDAINRAKNRNRNQEDEILELKEEFRNIISNPIFPLGMSRLISRW